MLSQNLEDSVDDSKSLVLLLVVSYSSSPAYVYNFGCESIVATDWD